MKFESDAEIEQISADFERGRFSKVSLHTIATIPFTLKIRVHKEIIA